MAAPIPQTLVTLAAAKEHLRIFDDASNADIKHKLDQATEMILLYLANPADETWTATIASWGDETPAPLAVQGAILSLLAELMMYRGDDPSLPARDERGPGLSPSVKLMLWPYRPPVFA